MHIHFRHSNVATILHVPNYKKFGLLSFGKSATIRELAEAVLIGLLFEHIYVTPYRRPEPNRNLTKPRTLSRTETSLTRTKRLYATPNRTERCTSNRTLNIRNRTPNGIDLALTRSPRIYQELNRITNRTKV